MIEITTPVTRLVAGHPMQGQPRTDDNNQPKLGSDGQPLIEYYIGIAIPKAGEADWKQTAWGAQFVQEATTGWPNGESQAPTFAWKVTDGDSTIPNKKGKVPNQRDGWAGHWVLHCSTTIPFQCFHKDKYDPSQAIMNKTEIKTGDYCRVVLNVKANNPAVSPGLYLNPVLFELSSVGAAIAGSGPSAQEAFGGGSATAAPVAQAAPTVAAAPAPQAATPPPSAPHNDFLNVPAAPAAPAEKSYMHQGQVYTESALLAAKWSPAQIATLQEVPA